MSQFSGLSIADVQNDLENSNQFVDDHRYRIEGEDLLCDLFSARPERKTIATIRVGITLDLIRSAFLDAAGGE